MLSLLINKFKRALLILLTASLLLTSMGDIHYANNYDQANNSTCIETMAPARQCEIIIRAGEYVGKPGKRIYINNQTVNLPDDIPVRNDHDGKGFYVHEADINIKEAKALVAKLQARGINATLQIAESKAQDLNAAGRIANKSNPYIYLSLHHNYYDSNSSGYFAMHNPGDAQGKILAKRLADAIKNDKVPQYSNRENTGYIGELNVINNSTTPVLLELGFFSNLKELEVICSNSYVDYISTHLANELYNIIHTQYKGI